MGALARRGARYHNAQRRAGAAVRFTGVPVFRYFYLATSEARRRTLAALPHRAQSSVRV